MSSFSQITPVILSGGSGTRLWPVSRRAFPKQFVPLVDETSLFKAAVQRLDGVGAGRLLVVAADAYRFIVRDQLAEIDASDAQILIEPDAKNTGPAILAASLVAQRNDSDAIVLVMPSDHVIKNNETFFHAVDVAREAAQDGSLITFGVKPTRPETGYGYLEPAGKWTTDEAVPLRSFVEKPEAWRAEEMLRSGNFLWNAGIFLFRADALIDAFQQHQPDMLALVKASVDGSTTDIGFERLGPEPWSRLKADSIDYAIMEKAETLRVVAYTGGWSDLGDWEALWREGAADTKGVVSSGNTIEIDCTNSYLHADGDAVALVGVGLEDIVAIATEDAVLVVKKDRVQDVRQAVEALKTRKAPQVERFARDHRPWGWYDVLALSERFQVKRIVVRPGAALSLQSHVHRSEHWVVVSGTARVTIDDDIKLVAENESVYIPLGAKHRLENPGTLPMTLIEVQTGSYLGEDDIVRYEDVYARS